MSSPLTFHPRIIIEKGKTVHNPIPAHPDVCAFKCKQRPDVRVTHLITRHHSDKSVGLFYCEGCPPIIFKCSIVPTHSTRSPSTEAPTGPKQSIAPTDSMASPIAVEDSLGVVSQPHVSTIEASDDEKTLSKQLQTRFLNLGYCLTCPKCKKPLALGDKYHKTRSRYKSKRFYHSACWESLFIEVPS